MRGFLARLTHGDGADDLAQETFLKAWRSAGAWRGEGSYEGWLLRIAWRTFLSSRRGGREEPSDAVDDRAAAGAGPDTRIDIERALALLSPRERATALLCFGEGYSHGEAAAILVLPLGTVKSLAARAKAALARSLEEHQG